MLFVPRGKRRAAIELFHWGYGAGGGVAFALLPDDICAGSRGRGPSTGSRSGSASSWRSRPCSASSQSKKVRPVDRAGLAADHVLYGLVLNECAATAGERRVSRVRARVEGTVQGVGFRPYVYRLAGELGVAGHVLNDSRGVVVEVEAPAGDRRALPRPPLRRGAAARHRRARHLRAARGARRARLLDPRQPGRRGAARGGDARQRHLRGLPGRGVRPGRPPLPLPVHELHELRARASRSCATSRTTARTPRWPASRCAPPAAPSTTTRRTAASTPSRTPARSAARGCSSATRAAGRWRHAGARDAVEAAARALLGGRDRRRQGPRRLPPRLPRERRGGGGGAAGAQAPRGQAVRADGAGPRGGAAAASRWTRWRRAAAGARPADRAGAPAAGRAGGRRRGARRRASSG